MEEYVNFRRHKEGTEHDRNLNIFFNRRNVNEKDAKAVSYTHLDVYKRQTLHKETVQMVPQSVVYKV